MKKRILLCLLLLATTFSVYAQNFDVVKWTFSLVDKGDGEVELTAVADIDDGWHLYDINIPKGGPNATTLSIDKLEGATKVGDFKVAKGNLVTEYDKDFSMNLGSYADQVTFVQRLKVVNKDAFVLEGDIRAQACTVGNCTPPLPVDFEFTSKDLPRTLAVKPTKVEPAAVLTPATKIEEPTTIPATKIENTATTASVDLWKPVIKELEDYGAAGSTTDASLIWMFILGIGGGLVALMTPCVWPLIPMTVSFFLKRNKKNKAKAVKDAVIYGLSIIVIYVSLGLLITVVFGASALNDLSTSALFNLIFFALLVFFAASFLGAFELTLPASWSNKIDSKADSAAGILSIFFMAFTLALVSFSCTGPVIGTVLVQAASTGALLAPSIVMFGFALALAVPFTLFALFPSWLESMPKSGGWLNSVKVVLGFLELALALKFFSVADLAYGWHLMDREVFLVLWIVIFTLLGLYLLGKLKFAHDDELESISVKRLLMAIISIGFAIYLVPGLWGAPLKAVSAFSPPLWTQDFNLYDGAVHAKFQDYEEGMAYAKKNDKPVIIDFSGYGCVNCRKMESSVWSDPRVKGKLDNDYVLITLMVDDKAKLPEVMEVTESNGKKVKLKTIGDKWSYFQRHKFGTNSQPYYILLDHEGMPIGRSYAFDEDVDKYIKFLDEGINKYEELKNK